MSAVFDAFHEAAKRERKQELGHELAIEASCVQIECCCQRAAVDGTWWNTRCVCPDHPDEHISTQRAVEYLELCDLLERDPTAQHIVRIRHEVLRKGQKS